MTEEQQQFLTEKYFKQRKFLLEYAESSLHNFALSEEAVQQTFEIACRRIDDFQSSPNPEAWLTKTLSLVLRNLERNLQVERRIFLLSSEYRPDLVAAPAESKSLQLAYGTLADTPHFQILYETEVLGRSLVDVAGELGISPETCRKRAQRARAYLKKRVKNKK